MLIIEIHKIIYYKRKFLKLSYLAAYVILFAVLLFPILSITNYNQEKTKLASNYEKIQEVIPTFIPAHGLDEVNRVKKAPKVKLKKVSRSSKARSLPKSNLKKKKKKTPVKKKYVPDYSKISYSPFGVNVFTAEDYNKMLRGTGLEGYGKTFKNMERKYQVNGLYAIAVAMHESAMGKSPLKGNNYFGMIGFRFNSISANIDYFGRLMKGRIYSSLRTIEEINTRYAAGSTWAGKVKAHMKARARIVTG